MKPVRINIQNKELWEKEIRLLKRAKTNMKISIVASFVFLIGAIVIPIFNKQTSPTWLGYAWCVYFVILVGHALWSMCEYQMHGHRAYIYKFGTKKQIRELQ